MSRVISLDAVDLVLRVAAATEGAMESGANAGPFVERVLKTTKTPVGSPWCAAWVAMVGVAALRGAWPVPLTAGCAAIGEWARQQQVRYLPKAGVQVGDLFLLYYPKLQRYAHVGFVWKLDKDGAFWSLEGNTSKPGDTDPARAREGWLVASKRRHLGEHDRLVRWAALLK